jgi:hypothetical protein
MSAEGDKAVGGVSDKTIDPMLLMTISHYIRHISGATIPR